MNPRLWPAAHDAALRLFFEAGLSASQSAAAINGEFHTCYSRNAVIGRLHRLGLHGMNKGGGRKKQDGRAAPVRRMRLRPTKAVLALAPIVVPTCEEIVPRHLRLVDLDEKDCRWPYGDGPFTFCALPGDCGPYCPAHQAASVGRGTAGERDACR